MMDGMAATPIPETDRTVLAPQRVVSVDVLRGITIAFMILVNDPGDWDHVFTQLDHAAWNGWTVTDLVFPTFLFLMGAAMVFSFAARAAKGDCRKTLTGHVFARAAKIFSLDLALVLFPHMDWTGMRVYGVLTRIALCYLLAGLVLVATMKMRRRTAAIMGVVALLLVGYWVLLRWVPVPGAGLPVRDVPLFDPDRNLAAWLDRGVSAWMQHWLNTGVLYENTRDPEGLLSTLPAVASTLLGSLAGMWMRRAQGARGSLAMRRMQSGLALAGLIGVLAGEIWSRWFPINKNLWTSSYVLLTAGIAAVALAALSWLMDGRTQPWPRWLQWSAWPWRVYGSNAIAAYTFSAVLVEVLEYVKFADSDGDKHSLSGIVYEAVFARNESTDWTSLAYGLSLVVVCFLPVWWMWRKKWFWKM
jgi:predicted acyltransferase